MKKTFHRLYLLPLFVAAACSGADSPEEPKPNPRPPVERALCEAMTAGCERQITCGAVVYNHATTVEACVEQTGCAAFTKAQLAELDVALDVERLDACVDALEALDCEQVAALRFGFGEDLAVCEQLAKGTVAEGAACHGLIFDDCAEGFECAYDLECPGTCRPRVESCTQDSCGAGAHCSYAEERCLPLGAIGAACEPNLPGDDARRTCAAGAYCAYQENGESRCEATVPFGASCEACLDPSCCATGAYCEYGDGSETPRCVERRDVGGECFYTAMCDEGLYCDFPTNACATPANEGQACNGSSGGCRLGLVCVETNDGGVCASPNPTAPGRATLVAQGAACDASSVCGLGLTCVDDAGLPLSDFFGSGTCQRSLAPAGTACSPSIDAHSCSGGLCNFATETCPAPLAVGAACSSEGLDTGCPYGLCFDGKCAAPDELLCENVFGR